MERERKRVFTEIAACGEADFGLNKRSRLAEITVIKVLHEKTLRMCAQRPGERESGLHPPKTGKGRPSAVNRTQHRCTHTALVNTPSPTSRRHASLLARRVNQRRETGDPQGESEQASELCHGC